MISYMATMMESSRGTVPENFGVYLASKQAHITCLVLVVPPFFARIGRKVMKTITKPAVQVSCMVFE